ncbi:hypothetical protein GUJ93_ZPchr0013g35905 [Zizania palustris]|uniref:Sugar phosphate transporter domain-containing protein n=1 Tax=Zizania palustris TaxID=103762 RepID=A0A8J5WXG4_ZIZPA|nr:hypothetical protein GUJ93_ZPchr0013g35905 [Zizania palustris]
MVQKSGGWFGFILEALEVMLKPSTISFGGLLWCTLKGKIVSVCLADAITQACQFLNCSIRYIAPLVPFTRNCILSMAKKHHTFPTISSVPPDPFLPPPSPNRKASNRARVPDLWFARPLHSPIASTRRRTPRPPTRPEKPPGPASEPAGPEAQRASLAAAAKMMISRQLMLTYLYLLIYVCLSSGVILFNKWVLSPKYFKFPFPITLTMIHMAFSGVVTFFLVRVFKVVAPIKMTFQIYATCVIPISAFFASSLWFGNTAYLYISVAFIQMLKALMPVATFIMAVVCGTDKLRWDLFLNMVLVLLQKKGLTLNPITSLYYIAPCSFIFLFVPWYFIEKQEMDVSQIQFNYWIFFFNAVAAFALNISIFLVIGRTGAITIRVAGVLKDWILIALSTIIFPESIITSLNLIGYAAALSGVVMYNYLKMKDIRANQLPADNAPDRATKDKKISNIYKPDSFMDGNDETTVGSLASETAGVDEEAPLIPSSRLSYVTRTQTGSFNSR